MPVTPLVATSVEYAQLLLDVALHDGLAGAGAGAAAVEVLGVCQRKISN